MKNSFNAFMLLFFCSPILLLISCNNKRSGPSKEAINEINLKRGNVVYCGGLNDQFGSVDFEMSCNEKARMNFNLAIELLHSFEYDESEKVFAKIIDEYPDCAMAYWGVAMCNFHALWTPPTEAELKKGDKALQIANTITEKSERESAYISAIAAFYNNWKTVVHHTRCINYEKAMEKLQTTYSADKEASVFYALALDASADPSDKSFANQKKAAGILTALYPTEPNHPGIIHYIIHTYDYPGLAELALPAARKYAQVAPSSSHALHMPSHIFTRLGLWDESIKSNLESIASAICYAEQTHIKGHWDEELHGLDYLVYAYLQKGNNKLAQSKMEYLDSIVEVNSNNFKVAYAYAAIPSRFFLENKNWNKAASMQLHPINFPWKQFPWQESIVHFTRLMGLVNSGDTKEANIELQKLKQLKNTLEQLKDGYKAKQVAIQIKTGEAWIELKTGKITNAINLMKLASDMEDSTEKHPVTPGEVLPARELLGDILLQVKQNENALLAYEAVLKRSPNRFNSLYGAGLAAEKSGNKTKSYIYFNKLLSNIEIGKEERPEIHVIRSFLKSQK